MNWEKSLTDCVIEIFFTVGFVFLILNSRRFLNRNSWKFAIFCCAVRAMFLLFATFVDAPFCFAHSNPRDKSRGYQYSTATNSQILKSEFGIRYSSFGIQKNKHKNECRMLMEKEN